MPPFLQHISYVHWLYIVLVVSLFSALYFGFARERAGARPLGRFLSAFITGLWLVRLVLQWLSCDPELRRQNRPLDAVYNLASVLLVAIFAVAATYPVR